MPAVCQGEGGRSHSSAFNNLICHKLAKAKALGSRNVRPGSVNLHKDVRRTTEPETVEGDVEGQREQLVYCA